MGAQSWFQYMGTESKSWYMGTDATCRVRVTQVYDVHSKAVTSCICCCGCGGCCVCDLHKTRTKTTLPIVFSRTFYYLLLLLLLLLTLLLLQGCLSFLVGGHSAPSSRGGDC
jgi:hypothetical protein